MDNFQPGDHIRELEFGYFHHAIFIEWTDRQAKKARVIHHRGPGEGNCEIRDEWDVDVSWYSRVQRGGQEAVDRAMSRRGEGDYNLIFRNCEHFANWCVSGREHSGQITELATFLPSSIARRLGIVDETPVEHFAGCGGTFRGADALPASALPAVEGSWAQRVSGMRTANWLSVKGIFEKLGWRTGASERLGETASAVWRHRPDLATTMYSGETAAWKISNYGGSGGQSVRLSRVANSASAATDATTRMRTLMGSAQKMMLALEVASHVYNVYQAEPEHKVKASVQAAGAFTGSRIGGYVGSQLGGLVGGGLFGPPGALLGELIGGAVGGWGGGLLGNFFANRLVNELEGDDVGGVDLGGSLHFIDTMPSIDGIVLDPVANFALAAAGCSGGGAPGPFAQTTAHDLAVALKLAFFNRGEGSFSLDAFDPVDPFGEFQQKVFYPDFLAGTDIGELLFRADVLLKRICLGLETPPLPGWRGPFELGRNFAGHAAHRSWIVAQEMDVELLQHPQHPNTKYIRPGKVKMAVRACALRLDPTSPKGVVDELVTDPRDPACIIARQCTKRMDELIACYPTLQRLYACYQLVAMCRAMRELGVTVDYPWVELHGMPLFETPGKFRTLRNSRTTQDGSSTHTRTIVGGCVLASNATRLRYREVDARASGHADIFEAAARGLVCETPQCYRPGRTLREDRSDVEALLAQLNSGENTVEIHLPRPPVQEGLRLVALPFAACCGHECAACGRHIEGAKFQTVLGQPLCSRLHGELGGVLVGPTFRLTPLQACAVCREAIDRGEIITSFSSEEVAQDYHAHCAPADLIQKLADRDQAQAEHLEAVARALDELARGERLGGREFSTQEEVWAHRLRHFSSGNELVDTQRALRESLRGVPWPEAHLWSEQEAQNEGVDDEYEGWGQADQVAQQWAAPLEAPETDDPEIQEAIAASLADTQALPPAYEFRDSAAAAEWEDEQLQLALALSLSESEAQ